MFEVVPGVVTAWAPTLVGTHEAAVLPPHVDGIDVGMILSKGLKDIDDFLFPGADPVDEVLFIRSEKVGEVFVVRGSDPRVSGQDKQVAFRVTYEPRQGEVQVLQLVGCLGFDRREGPGLEDHELNHADQHQDQRAGNGEQGEGLRLQSHGGFRHAELVSTIQAISELSGLMDWFLLILCNI